MKRHRTHKIDDLAQRVFRASIPVTWVYNEQKTDYGKDYLVEIGDDDDTVTGVCFFVQLKGQEKVEFSSDGQFVKFSKLETEHAAYYADNIKCLPVFLVVVDVTTQRAYWHFIQPDLLREDSWRSQKTMTIYLPVFSDLRETAKLRQAVVQANKFMRGRHPEAFSDFLSEQRKVVNELDPRFDVQLAVVNDMPVFELKPTEPVTLTVEVKDKRPETQQKIDEMFEKGCEVKFEPGEVAIVGSKLLETVEKHGATVRTLVNFPGCVTLVSLAEDGKEIARLVDVPGRFEGGLKELRFRGGLEASPLSVEVGPITSELNGMTGVHFSLAAWQNQRLSRLAYFDRILRFTEGLRAGTHILLQCFQHDYCFFTAKSTMKSDFTLLVSLFTSIDKARKVAGRFQIDPLFTRDSFTQEAMDTAAELYGIFVEGLWTEKQPRVRRPVKFEEGTVDKAMLESLRQPCLIKMISECSCPFMGESINVGKLTFDYTDMRAEALQEQSGGDGTSFLLIGSEQTVLTTRPGECYGPPPLNIDLG